MVNEIYTLAGTVIVAASTIYTSRMGERARVAEERRLVKEREDEREALKEHEDLRGFRDERQHVIDDLEKANARLQALVDKHDAGCLELGMSFAEMIIFIRKHNKLSKE